MGLLASLTGCVIDVIYPERCCLCGCGVGDKSFAETGPYVTGLRRWDRPNLCRPCLTGLGGEVLTARLSDPSGAAFRIAGGVKTHGDLVAAVGAWKYHGLRGLAWPLLQLTLPALDLLLAAGFGVDTLVPVPLHRRRCSERGFNQAELLARLLGRRREIPVNTGLVKRTGATAQQASIIDDRQRAANVCGVFTAVRKKVGMPNRLYLVDDLVTSGATAGACAAALQRGGWDVAAILCIGLAAPSEPSPSAPLERRPAP